MKDFTEEERKKIKKLFVDKKAMDEEQDKLKKRLEIFTKEIYEVTGMRTDQKIDINDIILRMA